VVPAEADDAERGSAASGAGAQGFVNQARDRLGEATEVAKQKLAEVSESAQQTLRQTMDAAQETAQETSGRISAIKSQAAQGTESLTAKAGEVFSHAAETVRTKSSEAVSAASQMVSSGYRDGAQASARAGEQLLQTGQRAQETFAETVQRHPVVVGAVGLAIGAILAAALPVTRQEEQLLGDAGSELKKKAQDVASSGVEAVKGAAKDVYDETLAHAREQGLSAEGMREAAANVGEKVKDVIAKARDNSAEPGQTGEETDPIAGPYENRR
jgi:hypothetical protein